MNQQYPSILLEKAVGEFSKLPGIGRKTAMRLVLHLLRQDTATVEAFGNSIITLKREVKYCKVCHNISDTETCQICANPQRDASTVCVVENIRDVMAVEATQQYRGLYHVLGGVISPMDGVGPSDLQIESLVQRTDRPCSGHLPDCLPNGQHGSHSFYHSFLAYVPRLLLHRLFHRLETLRNPRLGLVHGFRYPCHSVFPFNIMATRHRSTLRSLHDFFYFPHHRTFPCHAFI